VNNYLTCFNSYFSSVIYFESYFYWIHLGSTHTHKKSKQPTTSQMNLTHLQTPVNVLSRCGAVYFRSVLIEVYEQTFLFSSFLYYFAFLLTSLFLALSYFYIVILEHRFIQLGSQQWSSCRTSNFSCEYCMSVSCIYMIGKYAAFF
jgi:hypothetical protein